MYKADLALNNLLCLICHKTQPTNQSIDILTLLSVDEILLLVEVTALMYMVLQTGYETEEWESYFISADSAKSSAATFAREKLTKENLQMMDRAMLKELGIMVMGEALSIPKEAKEPSTQTIYAKAPSAKLPQLYFKMTP